MSTQDEQPMWLSKTDQVSVPADEQVAFQATLLQRLKTNMEMAFENVPSGIYLYDHLGHILLVNALGARLLGYASIEEVLQEHNLAHMRQRFYAHYTVEYEDGTPFRPELGPVGRAIQEQRDIQLITRFMHKQSQQRFWALCRATPVFDEQGRLTNIIYSITDITQQKEAEERLREQARLLQIANDAFKELEQRKDQFISMASHELKTPVTSIAGFTEVLRRRFQQRDDEPSLRLLNRMREQIDKLTRLIMELLDISKMQAGQLEYRMELFDLDVLAREIAENMQSTTLTHRLILENPAPVRVLGDRDRIEQVLINLLTNAIKYSPQADTVIVRVGREEQKAIVGVQDFGIGIAEAHQDEIFERFYRINQPVEKMFPGLGIGLYITREIIKQHQGHIEVQSIKGKGSTFIFTLPLAQRGSDAQKEGRGGEPGEM